MLTVPLPIEALQKVISDRDQTYVINYKDSKVKGRPFIFYLSNLDIKASVSFTDLTVEELSELLQCYMEVNVLFKCEELNVLAALTLLRFCQVDIEGIATFTVPEGFYESFIESNEELLFRYFVFISSMVKYCDYIRDVAAERPHDLKDYEGVIDDGKFIGLNVVWLFEIPSFFELFFSSPYGEFPQYFFPVQFEDFVFNGKKLVSFFVRADHFNWLLATKAYVEEQHGQQTHSVSESSGAEAGRE